MIRELVSFIHWFSFSFCKIQELRWILVLINRQFRQILCVNIFLPHLMNWSIKVTFIVDILYWISILVTRAYFLLSYQAFSHLKTSPNQSEEKPRTNTYSKSFSSYPFTLILPLQFLVLSSFNILTLHIPQSANILSAVNSTIFAHWSLKHTYLKYLTTLILFLHFLSNSLKYWQFDSHG